MQSGNPSNVRIATCLLYVFTSFLLPVTHVCSAEEEIFHNHIPEYSEIIERIVGFNFGSYALDYSIKPYADLGTSQRVSFRIGF